MANQNFKVKKGLEVGTALTATSDGLNVTGVVTATQFSGDGSGLTGITAAGSGVVVQEEGSNVGTAATINFIGSNVTAAISSGIANVTVSAGGLSNVVEDTTPQLGGNLDLNSKNITGTGNISITGGLNATGVSTFQESVTFQSHASFGDSDKINFGNDQDLQIYHDGSNSYIDETGTGNLITKTGQYIVNAGSYSFMNADNSETLIYANSNNEVQLHFNGSKKFETTGVGVTVFGTTQTQQLNVSGISTLGSLKVDGTTIESSGQINLATNGSAFTLDINTTDAIIASGQGASQYVQLYGAGSEKIRTAGYGVTVTGTAFSNQLNVSGISTFQSHVHLGDDDSLYFGAGDDLEIKHIGGSFNNIQGSPELRIQSASKIQLKEFGTTEVFANFIADGAVELFHDNSKKFETTGVGASCVGIMSATNFVGDGSGLTSLTGASAGTYGASTNTPIITVDSNGRITGISTVATSGAGGGGGISNIVEDTTPQLGGNLDLNSKDITGSGDLDYTGNLKVTGISTITGVAGFSSHITLPDHAEIQVGSATGGDLKIYHNGSYSVIADEGTGELVISGSRIQLLNATRNEKYIDAFQDGAVDIYHNNALRLKTTGTGVNITDDLNVAGISTFADNAYFNDEVAINRSTTNTALSIKFSNVLKGRLTPEGSAFKVSANASNDLRLVCNDSGGTNGDVQIATGGGAGKMALFTGSGTAELYYQDSKKFETTNTGATVTGTLTATAFSGDGSALTNLPASGITTSQSNTQVTYNFGASGNNYVITGPGYSNTVNNPDLYLVRGQRYRFINATGTSHPLRIQSDTSGTAYTDGVSGSQSGTQEFNVQHDAPSRLFYQCTIHSGMIGNIYITGGANWQMADVAESASAEIFTLNSVGIGTDNPSSNIDVQRSGTGTIAKFGIGDGTTSLDIKYSSNTTTFDQQNDKSIAFETGDAERLRITSAGLVGIGTNSMSSALQIYAADTGEGTAKGQITLKDTAAYNQTPTGGIVFQGHHTTGAQAIFAGIRGFKANTGNGDYDGCLAFDVRKHGAVAYEAMRINEDGEVGIGTDNPDQRLHITNSSGDAHIRLRGSTNYGILYTRDSDGSLTGYVGSGGGVNLGSDNIAISAPLTTGNIIFQTGGTASSNERLRITSAGIVGINTTTGFDTSVGLAVRNGQSGSDHTMIDIIANTNETSRVVFSDDADHNQGRIQYNHNGNSLGFYTNGDNERLRIDPDGSIILGYGGASLYFQNGFNDSNSRIQNGGGSNNSNLRFYTRSSGTEAERLRIQSDGNVIPASNDTYNLGLSGSRWNKVWTQYVRHGTRSATYEKTFTATSDGSGNLTFECGILWLIDDSSFEVFCHIDRTGSYNNLAARYKFYGSKVSGFGTQGTYRSDTATYYIISPMSNPTIDDYTPSGQGSSHGTRIRHTSAVANAEYRLTMLINWVGQREVT